MNTTLEILVEQAKNGDKRALEDVVQGIQDLIYGLAIRMLWHPADAEDATQEILIKIITHLDSFRGESAFTSWVYRIASNHLLTTQKCQAENNVSTFEDFEKTLDRELQTPESTANIEAEQSLIVQEIMIGCTMGMLLCLNRDLRLAYILGDVSEMNSERAAYILNITPATFRKRLSRARTLLRNFMQKKCGLVNPNNPCRCSRFVDQIEKTMGRDPENFLFAGHPCRGKRGAITSEQLREIDELQRIIVLFRNHPDYAAPDRFIEGIKGLIDSGEFKMFQ